MKYWEIVKILTENPTLSGVAVIGSTRYEIYVDDSGTLQSATHYLELGTNGTSIGKAGNIDFDGWEIVKQPVTWQEAIQAWAEGKTITCKTGITEKFALTNYDLSLDISLDKITYGVWYVEE